MAEQLPTRAEIDAETATVRHEFAHLAETTRQDIREAWYAAGYRVDHMTPRQQALELEGERDYDRIYDPQTFMENNKAGSYDKIDQLWRRHEAGIWEEEPTMQHASMYETEPVVSDARDWRQEGYAQQELEHQAANEAAWERMCNEEERLVRYTSMYETEPAVQAPRQLQAFEGKTANEQKRLYVQQVTQDAIQTGAEEGYPIRDRALLEKQVARMATPENIEAYKAGLRQDAGMSQAESTQEQRMDAGQEERGAREPAPEHAHRWQAMQQMQQDVNAQWLANNRPAWERSADTDRSR